MLARLTLPPWTLLKGMIPIRRGDRYSLFELVSKLSDCAHNRSCLPSNWYSFVTWYNVIRQIEIIISWWINVRGKYREFSSSLTEMMMKRITRGIALGEATTVHECLYECCTEIHRRVSTNFFQVITNNILGKVYRTKRWNNNSRDISPLTFLPPFPPPLSTLIYYQFIPKLVPLSLRFKIS